ncbi:MAG TPA: sensor domain-containing protein [Rhizomicrobium sp.]|jgi:uncharacterized membrane protein
MNTGRQPDTVRAYLDALSSALKALRCPAGLISDARADAEEHLNNEIATHPELSEAEILASVIETYGTPDEIAEEYKSMEATLSGPFPKSEEPQHRRYGFFGVLADPRAYGAIIYMLLSLFTGIFYYVWTLVTGILTLVFSILIIGIPLLPAYFASLRGLGLAEGRLIEGLLGVRMPRRLPSRPDYDAGMWMRAMDALGDLGNWTTMFYLLLRLPLGIFYFVLAIVGFVVPGSIALFSVVGLVTGHSHMSADDVPWLDHIFNTAPGLAAMIVVSLILFILVLHLARGIGWLHGRLAELLLVRL